jgi:hypothetical protein
MFRRRQRRRPDPIDHDPVVFDVHGMPVGVRAPTTAGADETTRAGRYHARLAALRKTHELDSQFQLRSSSCMFCSAPPS